MMRSGRPAYLTLCPKTCGLHHLDLTPFEFSASNTFLTSFQLNKHGLNNYHVPSLMLGALGDSAIFLLTEENKSIHYQLKYLTTACEMQSSDDILVMSTEGPEFIQ